MPRRFQFSLRALLVFLAVVLETAARGTFGGGEGFAGRTGEVAVATAAVKRRHRLLLNDCPAPPSRP